MGEKLHMPDAVKVLYPPSSGADRPMDRHRFSQLLLEHGERHLQDWAVIASSSHGSPQTMKSVEGRLHLCSRSVVFEPADVTRGVLRFPFVRMETSPHSVTTNGNDKISSISIQAKRHLMMKVNNKIAPFESIEVPADFKFSFQHSSPDTFVDLSQKLFAMIQDSGVGSKGYAASAALLEEMLRPMLDRPFDSSNLIDIRERPQIPNLRCKFLTPLQAKPGCALMTQDRFYFQPATGILGGSTKAKCWVLRDAVAIARRYYGLRDSALELYWKDGTSVLLAFESRSEREQVMKVMPQKYVPCHTDRSFLAAAVQAWMDSKISNYEYLLVLNSAAGRTRHDLSRYPVFPWVLSEYRSSKVDLTLESSYRDLSKPVGALSEERLAYFQERLEGMQEMEDPFLYGTHYSAPGYVLYYLVRAMPEHMLCLQNGKFDASDRMFHSMEQCYSCVLQNHADVKELIPEFYDPNGSFDFLINARSLQLGTTQTGYRVHDVGLPPWARSPRDFLRKNRKALESDICSRMLPRWIDLIFGELSRGEKAKESSNLFHPMAYLGPADLEAMKSNEERLQAELQATEFGIVPDQLFQSTHPSKGGIIPNNLIVTPWKRSIDGDDYVGRKHTSNKNGEQTCEMLDNPDSGIARRKDTYAPNLNKSQNIPSTKAGFGAVDVPGTQMSSFSGKSPHKNQNLPVSCHGTPTESKPLTTPRGKAQESWKKSASLPMTTQAKLVDLNDTDGEGNADRLKFRSSSTYDDSRSSATSNHRTLALSGSGDMTRKLQESRSFEQATSGSENAASTRAAPPTPVYDSLGVDDASKGWDMNMIGKKALHSDAVSGCTIITNRHNERLLVTVALDGSLLVHKIPSNKEVEEDRRRSFSGVPGALSRFPYISITQGRGLQVAETKLAVHRSYTSNDPLACLAVTTDNHGGHVIFSGGHDDVVFAYGINSACAVASVYSHRDAVTGLDLIQRDCFSNSIWAERSAEKSTHLMISGSWDATVKVWSVSVDGGETVSITREPLVELYDAESSMVCLSATSILCSDMLICVGCADGSFVAWMCQRNGVNELIHKESPRRGYGSCASVKFTTSLETGCTYLFVGFSTGKIASYCLKGKMLERSNAVSVGVGVHCLDSMEGLLFVGCADGGLRLIPIAEGATFNSKPTLWNAVNGKKSPGLTCVHTVSGVEDGQQRFLCCTGSNDGTVCVFDLSRAQEK